MSSASIQAKIKAGLSRAVTRTGSSVVDKVYLVVESGGSIDPITPVAPTKANVELVNAVFTAYDIRLVGANIRAGDRQLISDDSVIITVGATIKQGTVNYIVIGTTSVSPTSDVLLYKSQLRVK